MKFLLVNCSVGPASASIHLPSRTRCPYDADPSDWDSLLGFNAMQTTLGATAKLVGAHFAPVGDSED